MFLKHIGITITGFFTAITGGFSADTAIVAEIPIVQSPVQIEKIVATTTIKTPVTVVKKQAPAPVITPSTPVATVLPPVIVEPKVEVKTQPTVTQPMSATEVLQKQLEESEAKQRREGSVCLNSKEVWEQAKPASEHRLLLRPITGDSISIIESNMALEAETARVNLAELIKYAQYMKDCENKVVPSPTKECAALGFTTSCTVKKVCAGTNQFGTCTSYLPN